ncbi:MAG: hypothetical protein GXX83_05485 [Gaiellales bacterium]|nr:hypothetical protein [Gaiellales bacterium]
MILVVLPVLALIALQVTGVVWFTLPGAPALAAGPAGADYLVLRAAVRLFQHETIVPAWR